MSADKSAENIQRSEFANGSVVVEQKEGDVAEVTHECVGCGEEIRTFEIFDDRTEEALEEKPVCEDTVTKCRNKAREVVEAEA